MSLEPIAGASEKPRSSEQIKTPESSLESGLEQALEKELEALPAPKAAEVPMPTFTPPSASLSAIDLRESQIDKILSEDLESAFIKMKPKEQARFKVEGEKTVKKINLLLSSTKVKIKKIASLIRRWLNFIPGINKFFLEQETKIKTDKILDLKK